MPSEEAQKLIAEFQSARTDSELTQVGVSAWLQPQNKEEDCKLFFRARFNNENERPFWETEQTEIYWDGECKDGYAFGIGREFVENISSGLFATLAYYGEPGIEPSYYYYAYYDDHRYTYVLQTPETKAANKQLADELRIYNNGRHDFSITKALTVVNEVTGAKDQYIDYLFKSRSVHLIGFGSDRYIRTESSGNPADELAQSTVFYNGNERLAGAFRWTNGAERFAKYENGVLQNVQFPSSLLSFLQSEGNTSQANLRNLESDIQASKRAMSTYKRRICQGDVTVDFMDDSLYGQICLPDGDLSRYSDQISKYKAKSEKQQAKAERRLMERQKLAVQKRQIAVRQANQKTKENRKAMSESISSLNDTMSKFNQDATALRQNTASQPTPVVNFGSSRSTQTNCVKTSNTIHCKSY